MKRDSYAFRSSHLNNAEILLLCTVIMVVFHFHILRHHNQRLSSWNVSVTRAVAVLLFFLSAILETLSFGSYLQSSFGIVSWPSLNVASVYIDIPAGKNIF
jgi:hypothetical protein